MALPTWTCLLCEKEFRAGNWNCASGGGHVVKPKRYYMNDAPTVPDASGNVNKRDAGTLILNIPPETRTTGPDGNERVIPGGSAQFVRGIYETNDPQKIFWLDQHKGMCSEAEWKAAYLNDREKMDIEKMEIAAMRLKLDSDRNELLAHVQQKGA
jgi:hypothetical protein